MVQAAEVCARWVIAEDICYDELMDRAECGHGVFSVVGCSDLEEAAEIVNKGTRMFLHEVLWSSS